MTTAVDEITNAEDEIPRDRWDRYLIKQSSGKLVGYTRATTIARALDDHYNLHQRDKRLLMLGLVERPDLIMGVSSQREHRDALDRIAQDALTAGGAFIARDLGTALHKLCEKVDAGVETGPIPLDFARDIEAYRQGTRSLRVLHSESIVVLDELKIAGRLDRVVEYDGERFIADIKTGSIEYAATSIAVQLAIYAHGMRYDKDTGERAPLPGVSGERGIVIHLPAGKGACSLHWVDIKSGWEQVQLALDVRAWRKRKNLLTPINEAAAFDNLQSAGLIDDPIKAQIDAATSVEQLGAIWQQYAETSWTDEHTKHAAARKAAISGASS